MGSNMSIKQKEYEEEITQIHIHMMQLPFQAEYYENNYVYMRDDTKYLMGIDTKYMTNNYDHQALNTIIPLIAAFMEVCTKNRIGNTNFYTKAYFNSLRKWKWNSVYIPIRDYENEDKDALKYLEITCKIID